MRFGTTGWPKFTRIALIYNFQILFNVPLLLILSNTGQYGKHISNVAECGLPEGRVEILIREHDLCSSTVPYSQFETYT